MTFVFVFYIPVQFSKSFPLSFRTARWLSHLVLPMSTVFFISFFLMLSAAFQLTVNVSLLFPDWLAVSLPQRLVYITSYLLFWQALFFPIIIHACMYLSNRHSDFGLFIIIFLLRTKYYFWKYFLIFLNMYLLYRFLIQ